MTLLRQLTLLLITLFVLLFVGTVFININGTRTYFNAQLSTISQDTATSLGLTLSPHIADKEMAIVESMVNATFDSGYYREVSIHGVDGKPILERSAPVSIEGVPAWFIKMFPLKTPRGEALLMAGWQQAGTITVAANPGQAYIKLWENSINAFWLFLAALIASILLGMLALEIVLRPLRTVESQARAISDREYPVQGKLPRTLELRSVVIAMNRMTSKIKDMFDEQSVTIERLRTESYRDPLTGLANRRYFDTHLKQLIDSPEESGTGALIFIELKGFKELNARLGYTKGDELLRETANVIKDTCAQYAEGEYFIARLAGATFALVLSGVSEKDAWATGDRMAKALPKLRQRGLIDQDEVGHVGVAMYRGQDVGRLLAEADMALRAAQGKGANAAHMQETGDVQGETVYSATRWSEFLRQVIDNKNIILHMQPVRGCADKQAILQYETLLRIADEDGKLIPAGIFVPMAKRLGLIREIDKLVVTEVMHRIKAGRYGGTRIAVNLFPTSVHSSSFVDWLCDRLREDPVAAKKIAFEVSEYGALENLDALRTAVSRVRELGGSFGLDHFGRGFSSFGYLSTLKIDYLKIDGSYIRGIAQNKDNQFMLDAVTKIAHGLDLMVVAESVETDEEWGQLIALRLDGVQGYGVGHPGDI